MDEITFGRLHKNRPTLVIGSIGTGKSFLSMQYILKGAVEFNEPGVFMTFEEKSEELIINNGNLGYDRILSNRAINNCKSIFEKNIFNRYKLEIIDVSKNPQTAIEENIIMMPLLIRKFPKPELRIIGDLSDTSKVLNELDIT